MPSLPALPSPLSDGVVALRPSQERDIPEVLIGYQDDRDLHRALGEPRPPSGAALGRRSEEAEEERVAGRSLTLAILEGQGDVCRGEVRISDVDWAEARAAGQIWIVPERRGKGMARRAFALAAGWLQETCGLTLECSGRSAGDVAG